MEKPPEQDDIDLPELEPVDLPNLDEKQQRLNQEMELWKLKEFYKGESGATCGECPHLFEMENFVGRYPRSMLCHVCTTQKKS